MISTVEPYTEIDHFYLDRSEQRWRDYLGIAPDQVQISHDHHYRLALTRLFQQYHHENRKVFHLTVTYKPYQDRTYSAKNTNDFFINFYLKSFLPYMLKTKNYHTPSKRQYQPICYAFLDEHEHQVSACSTKYAERLHHHAILAVHPGTYTSIQSLEGECTVPLRSKFSKKVMTTHLRECEPMTVLYATKNLRKYPDFLCFPDRFDLNNTDSLYSATSIQSASIESTLYK